MWDEPWVLAAKALPIDGSCKIQHGCGDSKAAHINHTARGWSLYCHRCGDSLFVPKPLPTLAERSRIAQVQRDADTSISVSPTLPTPQEWDVQAWPAAARLWLYKAGLSNADIQKLGAYYHEPTNRVVIPYVMDNKVVFWQARRLSGDGAKYLSPAHVDRSRVVGMYGAGNCIVIVEDALSAFKVGKVSWGWSLLGTKVLKHTLAKLVTLGLPVVTWLDNDVGAKRNSGQLAALEIKRSLDLVGIPTVNVVTDKDPKAYSYREITEILGGTGLL